MFDVAELELLDAAPAVRLGHRLVLLGAYDLAQYTRQMNSLQQVTVAIARALQKGGQTVIDGAISAGKGGLFSRELPGQGARQNVKGHLAWHAQRLAGLGDPTAPYDAAQDLKKWVLQAYIEANAIEEGRAAQEQAWQDMWTEIGQELLRAPQRVLSAAAEAVSTVVSSAVDAAGSGLAKGLGIPTWLFWTGGAALVVALGVGVFKVLLVAAPAVVPAVVRRYVP